MTAHELATKLLALPATAKVVVHTTVDDVGPFRETKVYANPVVSVTHRKNTIYLHTE